MATAPTPDLSRLLIAGDKLADLLSQLTRDARLRDEQQALDEWRHASAPLTAADD